MTGETFRVAVNGGLDFAEVESVLAGVRIHRRGEIFQIAESFLGGGDRIAGGVQIVEKMFKEFALARFRIHHQVMRDRPGFRIEHRGVVGFVIIMGRLRGGKEGVDGDEAFALESLQMVGSDAADLDLFVFDDGICVEFRQTFVEPNW